MIKNNILNNAKNNVVPVFYACDDNFVKYTIVSIKSLQENADKSRSYKIYILNTGITMNMKEQALALKNDTFDIEFIDVESQLNAIGNTLPIRDYYSKTTYFRMFIAEMFPMYDKAVYIDSDTVVLGDVSKLYDTELFNNYVGACHEQAMVQEDVFGTYVEKVLGIDRNEYFNAGILLLNCKAFRDNNVLERFIDLLGEYTFVVTQDQDYLNVICKDKVLWLNQGWNTEVFGTLPVAESEMKIIHYIMTSKPWHYYDCRLKEYFWKYTKMTNAYSQVVDELESYTDELRERDRLSGERLKRLAINETLREDNYYNVLCNKKVMSGLKLLKKSVNMKVSENLI